MILKVKAAIVIQRVGVSITTHNWPVKRNLFLLYMPHLQHHTKTRAATTDKPAATDAQLL